MVSKKCVLCSSWCSNYRSLWSSCYEWFYEYLRSNGTMFDKNDLHLCSSYVGTFYGTKETMNNLSVIEAMDVADESSTFDDEDRLTLENMIFARSGHTRYAIRRLEKPSGMVVMSKAARLDILILHSMYAPQGVRCCSSHLLNKTRLMHHTQVNTDNREHLSSSLSSSEIIELVEDLLSLLREAATSLRREFLDTSLTEKDYLA